MTTSSSECSHRIDIKNLINGETVNHSILLIKGLVRGQGCPGEKKLIQLDQSGGTTQSVHLKAQVSHSGEFKLLLDLRRYEAAKRVVPLKLQFRYCHEECALSILYKTRDTNYHLQPLYIVCRGEEVTQEGLAKNIEIIDLNLRLIQSVYAEKVRSAGFGRRTFALKGSCQLFQSQLTCEEAWAYTEDSLWQYFAQELLNSSLWGDSDRLKFVAFIACTKYDGVGVSTSGDFSYANIRKHLKAHAALGGGGLALFGSVFFYAWPQQFEEIIDCFRNDRKVDLRTYPDDSNFRRTYGGVFATTLGAICHELGHTFDLGHTSDEGVMGTGFDYVNRVFTVDNPTENLPTRVIHKGVLEAPRDAVRPRFTQIKRQTADSFLDKYRDQKQSDSFYFSRNCAVILAHHKWLSERCLEAEVEGDLIAFDSTSNTVVVSHNAHPLKIIEIRCNANGLVTYFYEFQDFVLSFQLPVQAVAVLKQQTHYIFVLTTSGNTKRLDVNVAPNELKSGNKEA